MRTRCVFYGDLYPNLECYDRDTATILRQLILARKKFAYGPLVDYFEHKNCIGFVRLGSEQHPGCAVVISNEVSGCVITTSFSSPLNMIPCFTIIVPPGLSSGCILTRSAF